MTMTIAPSMMTDPKGWQ